MSSDQSKFYHVPTCTKKNVKWLNYPLSFDEKKLPSFNCSRRRAQQFVARNSSSIGKYCAMAQNSKTPETACF